MRQLNLFLFALVALVAPVSLVSVSLVSDAQAREAAFVNPQQVGSGTTVTEAVAVEPSSNVDIGETTLNISRNVGLFFVNHTNAPVKIESVTMTSDSNVTGSILSDDCSKDGSIAPNSRCSVIVSMTPTNLGPWSIEVMMTHKSLGRIARAKISGRTSKGQSVMDRKDTGLALSSKEVNPLDFGVLDIGSRAVRSALMINDSPDPIKILSIDLIAPENGLERVEAGCEVNAELGPGESCPVTLLWAPKSSEAISTDVILRHTGKLSFVVIPVRGKTSGDVSGTSPSSSSKEPVGNKPKSEQGVTGAALSASGIPMPPTAQELQNIAGGGGFPSVSSSALSGLPGAGTGTGAFHLIGTVGSRAIFVLPDGTRRVMAQGDSMTYGFGKKMSLVEVHPKDALIKIDGKETTLHIQAVQSIITQGFEKRDERESESSSSRGRRSSSSSSRNSSK